MRRVTVTSCNHSPLTGSSSEYVIKLPTTTDKNRRAVWGGPELSAAGSRLARVASPETDPETGTDALETLHRVFGYDSFRGDQAAIVEHVIAGGDALVLMPTGGGKSLCYQIPALVRPGVGVVISPLIALMQDQVDALTALGVRAGFLNSTQDAGERRRVERAFLSGELDLLYLAPERLSGEGTL